MLFTSVALKLADIFAFTTLVIVVFTGREPLSVWRGRHATCLVTNGKRPEKEKPVDIQGFGFRNGSTLLDTGP